MPAEPIGPHMTATPYLDGWIVRTKDGTTILGTVEWHARWKLYELAPRHGTGYTASCCRDMAKFLDRVTAARKAGGSS